MSEAQKKPKIVVEPTDESATAWVAELVKSVICQSVAQRGRCCWALAGGTTPRDLYQRLVDTVAEDEVPWPAVEIFFGDERDVPQDDVDSNYRMVQRTLLDHVPIAPDNVHPMRADAEDIQAAAAEYERTLRERVGDDPNETPRFDLVLLGMGGDGHTASLFPGCSETLEEQDKLVTAYHVPVLGRDRMTITFPLIAAARNVVMLVTGPDKAEAVDALLCDDEERRRSIPAGRVRVEEGTFTLVLDEDAARLLDG